MGNQVIGLRKEFGKTLGADIAYRLREEIISCRLSPGEPLKFEPLRAMFDASFSTLRDALMALVADGLVVMEGQRGFYVAPVSEADLKDITDTRVLIETEVLRRAIAYGGDDWEMTLMASLHRLSKAEAENQGDRHCDPEWRRSHAQFHQVLVSACKSPTLLGIRGQLFERSERYRSLSSGYRPITTNRSAEHREIMLAAIARNADLAVQLTENHIRDTAGNVLKYASHLLCA